MAGPLVDAVDHPVVDDGVDESLAVGLEELVDAAQTGLGDDARVEGTTLGSRPCRGSDLVARLDVPVFAHRRHNVDGREVVLEDELARLGDIGQAPGLRKAVGVGAGF